jgi:hypothetical protein
VDVFFIPVRATPHVQIDQKNNLAGSGLLRAAFIILVLIPKSSGREQTKLDQERKVHFT